MNKPNCPHCASANQRPARREEWREAFIFAARRPWVCEGCGAIWEPATPRWALRVGIAAGLLLVGVAGVLLSGEVPRLLQALMAGCMGVGTLMGCWTRLRAAGRASPPPQPGPRVNETPRGRPDEAARP